MKPGTSHREELLNTLLFMTEESFGYMLLALNSTAKQYVGNGGFTQGSRDDFQDVIDETDRLINAKQS